MYLVINLTVADMFVGGFSNLYLFRYRLLHCDITKRNFITLEWQIKVALFIFGFLSGLSDKHCSHFIRSDACNNSCLHQERMVILSWSSCIASSQVDLRSTDNFYRFWL